LGDAQAVKGRVERGKTIEWGKVSMYKKSSGLGTGTEKVHGDGVAHTQKFGVEEIRRNN